MEDQGRNDRNKLIVPVSTAEDPMSLSIVFRTFYGTKLIIDQNKWAKNKNGLKITKKQLIKSSKCPKKHFKTFRKTKKTFIKTIRDYNF